MEKKWVIIEREYDGKRAVVQEPVDGRRSMRVCNCEFDFRDEAAAHAKKIPLEGDCTEERC